MPGSGPCSATSGGHALTRSPNAGSEDVAASSWTAHSSGTRPICGESCTRTRSTTISTGRTAPWTQPAPLKPLPEPVDLDRYHVRRQTHTACLINEYRLVALRGRSSTARLANTSHKRPEDNLPFLRRGAKPPGEGRALTFADQRAEQPGVAEQVHIPEEVLADVGVRGLAHPGCLSLVAEQEAGCRSERRQVGGIWQQDARAIGDLVNDPADRRADDRAPLPHSLGHGQPEPFGQALLHDDGGVPLQRVDHGRVLVDVIERQRNQQGSRPGNGP